MKYFVKAETQIRGFCIDEGDVIEFPENIDVLYTDFDMILDITQRSTYEPGNYDEVVEYLRDKSDEEGWWFDISPKFQIKLLPKDMVEFP